MFLDSDDEYDPEICEEFYNIIINKSEVDFVCCGFQQNFSDGKLKIYPSDPKYSYIIKMEKIDFFMEGSVFTMVWNKLFKKVLLMNIKYIFQNFYQMMFSS